MRFRLFSMLTITMALLFAFSSHLQAEEVGNVRSIQQLVGEDNRYAIDFLIFKKLAAGELHLTKTDQPNVYRAELVGRTLGVASWLSGRRTQIYTSLMELMADGSLRSIEHVSKIRKRRWSKWRRTGKRQRFDYVQGLVFESRSKNAVFGVEKEYVIPAGQQPVDMLTAFYNLRTGVYGPLVRGTKMLIPTYTKEKFAEIEVEVLTVEQQAEHDYFSTNGLLLQAKVDPEIFETDNGNMYIWLDKNGAPGRGIVEDVIGLGDVRGYVEENP